MTNRKRKFEKREYHTLPVTCDEKKLFKSTFLYFQKFYSGMEEI